MSKRKRSTVEGITWYDSPDKLYEKLILTPGWGYTRNPIKYRIRDLALISTLYIGTARITELVGGKVRIQGEKHDLPPITRDQFFEDEEAIWLRYLPIIKQRYVKRGSRWVLITTVDEYPKRIDIPFFKNEEPINKFTSILGDHLERIPDGDPVFNIRRSRADQIVKGYDDKWFCHYFRDQGLKYWNRYFKRDSFKLKKFSGHKKWSSLEKYMQAELFE